MSERGYDENAVRGGKKRERENKEVTFNNTPQRYRRGRHWIWGTPLLSRAASQNRRNESRSLRPCHRERGAHKGLYGRSEVKGEAKGVLFLTRGRKSKDGRDIQRQRTRPAYVEGQSGPGEEPPKSALHPAGPEWGERASRRRRRESSMLRWNEDSSQAPRCRTTPTQ